REAYSGQRERDEDERLRQDDAGVLLLDRVEDLAIPDVDSVLDEDLGQRDQKQPERENPGNAPRFAGPEALGGPPEALRQCCLLVTLKKFFVHLSNRPRNENLLPQNNPSKANRFRCVAPWRSSR